MSPLLSVVLPLDVLYLAAGLFAVGLLGVAGRRNVLVMLLSVEIMLNAANLAFVAFSKIHGDVTGQVFVFFAMAIAAAEVAVGLAIVICVYRLRQTADADAASDLRETDLEGPGPITPEGPDLAHGGGHGAGDHAPADALHESPDGHAHAHGHGHDAGAHAPETAGVGE